jgi:hypothetical protein
MNGTTSRNMPDHSYRAPDVIADDEERAAEGGFCVFPATLQLLGAERCGMAFPWRSHLGVPRTNTALRRDRRQRASGGGVNNNNSNINNGDVIINNVIISNIITERCLHKTVTESTNINFGARPVTTTAAQTLSLVR